MIRTSGDTTKFWADATHYLRCVQCGGPLAEAEADDALSCTICSRLFPIRDEVLVVKDEVSANNQVAKEFYNGPLWPKFRFWEWFTFVWLGGEKRSRNQVLRHLPNLPQLKLLDVAIGDGVYLDWLPPSWSVVGIDISSVQLAACRKRVTK